MSKEQPKIRYFLYARKSSEGDDRQVQSVEDQVTRMKEVAKSMELRVVDILTEKKSAKIPEGRLVFNDMIKRIERGEADGILCWKIDRLTRNPIDGGKLQWLLQQGKIKSIQTHERQYLPDDNALLLALESGMSNQYIRDLSKNVQRGLMCKIKDGWLPNLAPIGYLNDKENKAIIIDQERFAIVRKLWDIMLTGSYTPPQILLVANKHFGLRTVKRKKIGGCELSRSGIYRIFTNDFYAGKIHKNGKEYEGAHQPMITMEEFDHVQVLLGRKGKPRPKKHSFAFTGAIRCGECGCLITAETKQKHIKSTGKLNEYTYYHCTRKRKDMTCNQRKNTCDSGLELLIEQELDKYTILPEFRDWALEALNSANDSEIVTRTRIYEAQQKAVNNTQANLDRLTQMRYRDLINDDEFVKEKMKMEAEIAKLREKLKGTEARADKWLELTEKTFNYATYARVSFMKGDDQKKKEILLTLGQNPILKNQKLNIEAYKWFVPIANDAPMLVEEYKKVRTNKNLSTKAKNEAIASIRTAWLEC
jgi:DNA invertase Pin-like site-specific DNA recombinase